MSWVSGGQLVVIQTGVLSPGQPAGYEPVVYMNLHWAGSMYGMEALAHLPVWLASYGPVPALDRGVTLWQYSESGVVDGVEGPVDLDLWFTKE